MMQHPMIGVIADDFTGAMDCGAQFARAGLLTALRLEGNVDCEVEVIDTASREIPSPLAIQSCREAARSLKGATIFKKIDSSMRGHVADEIEAILCTRSYRKVLLCPAAPLQGRMVSGGILHVHGIPLAQSSFKSDPVYPACSSDVGQLLGRPIRHIPLSSVRGSRQSLMTEVDLANEGYLCPDAMTEDDLFRIAGAFDPEEILFCGAFGLARAMLDAHFPSRNSLEVGESYTRPKGNCLVIAGSANAATHRQLDCIADDDRCAIFPLPAILTSEQKSVLSRQIQHLLKDEKSVILCPMQRTPNQDPRWLSFGRMVSEFGCELLKLCKPSYTLLIGGESGKHFCNCLHIQAVKICGEVVAGIPWGQLEGGFLNGHYILTKAGGFGEDGTLRSLLFSE